MLHEDRDMPTSNSEIEVALDQLSVSAKRPYERFAMEPIMAVFREQRKVFHEPEVLAELEERDREEEELSEQARSSARELLGDGYYSGIMEDVSLMTLWDLMAILKDNADIFQRIEQSAKSLAERYGWDFEEVRDEIFMHVPVYHEDGSSCVILDGYPTIEAETKAIRNYLIKNYSSDSSMPNVKLSEVRKLFEYRAAAYADLMTWASLTRSTITAKCMAQALFPDGRFGELDMRPSRTVGGFFNRLIFQEGYLEDLVSKAAEMETLKG